MRRSDYLLLVFFCLIVFGVTLVGGRPLTMHEAVLPECTREMQARGDWLVPTSGGRPWLHRPPLPHWGMLILNLPLGAIQETWQVRLEPVLMAVFVTCLSAWMAQRWFGRWMGLLTGFILATSFQFVRYAWLAEEDMTLCAVITAALACFSTVEIPAQDQERSTPRFTLFGWQSWPLLGFFLFLGLSNLAKGLIFGPLMVLVPVSFYLMATFNWRRIGRYVWFWGILLAAAVAGLWPAWIYWKYPDVLEMWRYDYGGRLNGGYVAEPWWYYGSVLLWAMIPWTPCVFIGLVQSAKRWRDSLPARFLICWSVGVMLFFSIPDGKHHHYFLHTLPAWAMLSSLGLRAWWLWVGMIHQRWQKSWLIPALVTPPILLAVWYFRQYVPPVPGAWYFLMLGIPLVLLAMCRSLIDRQAWRSAGLAFSTIGLLFLAMHFLFGYYTDESRQDAAFLREVPALVPPDVPLIANAELRSCLEVNRILFDLKGRPRTVHNLTFLLDDRRQDSRLFLLSQAQDEAVLQALGTVKIVHQSQRSRREGSPGERLTLFELNLEPHLPRYSADVYIEQQQIKMRKPGPYLGGKSPKEWPRQLTSVQFTQTPPANH